MPFEVIDDVRTMMISMRVKGRAGERVAFPYVVPEHVAAMTINHVIIPDRYVEDIQHLTYRSSKGGLYYDGDKWTLQSGERFETVFLLKKTGWYRAAVFTTVRLKERK